MIITMLTTNSFAQNILEVKNLNPQEFKKQIESGKYIIIDVRTAEEFSQGHLHDAINIDVNNPDFLKLVTQKIKKNKQIALYCRSGRRSKVAILALEPMKLKIIELDKGYLSWIQAGFSHQ